MTLHIHPLDSVIYFLTFYDARKRKIKNRYRTSWQEMIKDIDLGAWQTWI